MPTAQALNPKPHDDKIPSNAAQPPAKSAQPLATEGDNNTLVRLHITPFNPDLLKVYLAPSVLPLAQNISFHSVQTFPEKGFGYVELPNMEAQKIKTKLNGSILKGSKVRVEDAKPEKRKAAEEVDQAAEEKEERRAAKRAKKEKKKGKEHGVLEGVELPDGRKVKRGWTEPATKHKKSDKKDKKEKKDKEKKAEQKPSKYTKEPELLFKAKLTPTAATELASKEKKKDKKKEKKEKKKSKSSREVVIHEFEKTTKHASFLKAPEAPKEKKAAVEYVDGQGWVDEDGNVVEPETGRARNRRILEMVDKVDVASAQDSSATAKTKSATPEVAAPKKQKKSSATPEVESKKSKKASATPEVETKKPKAKEVVKLKKKAATPPSSSSEDSSEEESSVVSSSEDSSSDSESEAESEASAAHSPTAPVPVPETRLTPASPTSKPSEGAEEKKEVHPLEALFKRPKPTDASTPSTNTPARLAPIKTSFSFFSDNTADGDAMDVDGTGNPPATPFTQKDLEWRGLRSAAPTPDTAAIGRRFSFPWRQGSQDQDDDEKDDADAARDKELNDNTKANTGGAAVPATIEEEDEDEDENSSDDSDSETGENEGHEVDANATPLGRTRAAGKAAAKGKDGSVEKEESEFAKWFWENRGDNNRAWKKRRKEALKMQRARENRKLGGAGVRRV